MTNDERIPQAAWQAAALWFLGILLGFGIWDLEVCNSRFFRHLVPRGGIIRHSLA